MGAGDRPEHHVEQETKSSSAEARGSKRTIKEHLITKTERKRIKKKKKLVNNNNSLSHKNTLD